MQIDVLHLKKSKFSGYCGQLFIIWWKCSKNMKLKKQILKWRCDINAYHVSWSQFSILKSIRLENEAEPFKMMRKMYLHFLQRDICTCTSISLMQKNKIVKYKSHRETHSISFNFQLFANERGRETASFLLLLLFIIVNHQHFHLDGFFSSAPSLSCHLVSFRFTLCVYTTYVHILSIEYIYRWCVCFLSICRKATSKDEIESERERGRERKSHLQFQFRFSHLVWSRVYACARALAFELAFKICDAYFCV